MAGKAGGEVVTKLMTGDESDSTIARLVSQPAEQAEE